MDRFLHHQRLDGHLDSEAGFTLASASALRKLARYSLERPGAWILKLVQAGVTWGAERLEVRIGSRGLMVSIHHSQPILWSQVQNAMVNGEAQAPGLEALASALWTVGLGAERRFFIQSMSRDYPALTWSGQDLVFNGKAALESEDPGELSIWIGSPEPSLLTRVSRLFGGCGAFFEEHQELVAGAYLCPIRLTIDSLEANGFRQTEAASKGSPGRISWRNYLEPFFWGTADPGGTLSELKLPPGWLEQARFVQKGGDYTPPQPMLGYGWNSESVGALWCLCYDFESRGSRPACEGSVCRWVCGGVVTDETPLEKPETSRLGLILYLSAEGLPTDLGGWKLRTGEAEFQKRLREGLKAVSDSLPAIPVDLPRLKFPEPALESCRSELEGLAEGLRKFQARRPPP